MKKKRVNNNHFVNVNKKVKNRSMKLELKHLAPYLPYGLKILEIRRGNFSNSENIAEQYQMHVGNINGLLNGKIYRVVSRKPILRPLSDLTKEVEGDEAKNTYVVLFREYLLTHDMIRHYDCDPFLDRLLEDQLPIELCCIYGLEWLLKNHFDINNLIEKGLAIDINNLEK